ncbi:mitochondrial 37S ribosomal protein [Martiniozyma asiatica (nom. inval.)]|nr:mitochondrial 37S ribosomal protein [Martiniozyma asiatica]
MFRCLRRLHTVPRLNQNFSPEGVKGLMSPAQFDLAWTQQQGYLTSKLSLATAETEFEGRTPFAMAISAAKDPLLQDTFFHASMAHNNHLFFEQLTNSTSESGILKAEKELKPELYQKIISTFGSMEDFKKDMISAANNLEGNGWIFLVEDVNKNLLIISSNNAGTPYNFTQNQSTDMNIPLASNEILNVEKNKQRAKSNEKDWTLPLLVINVWQHAYLLDYGIVGKEQYLQNVWDCIDWKVINRRIFSV